MRRTVVVMWIVAGTAVLFLILARLFSAAVPTPDQGQGVVAVGSGLPARVYGSGGYPYRYYEYSPPGATGQGVGPGAGQSTQFP